MKTRKLFKSSRLMLVLLLLAGGLSVSAVTFADSIIKPLEGTFLASLLQPSEHSVLSGITDATVSTDKQDYRIGETVYIIGSGFLAGETVRLQVTHVGPASALTPHQGHDPWDVTADENGDIAAEWLVDEDADNQLLRLTADGLTSTLHAETTFTDANARIILEQCHNFDGAPVNCVDPAGGSNYWGNGNAQAGNALLTEGNNQNFRAHMTDVPVGTHTLVLEFDITQSGKVAYDRFSSPARLKTALAPTGTQKADMVSGATSPESLGIIGCSDNGNNTAFCTPPASSQPLIPAIPAGVIPAGLFDADVRNSQTNDIPEHMFLYGNGTASMVSAGYSFSGTLANNSSLRLSITITKTVSAGDLLLIWGGHISKTSDYVTSGVGTAVTIPGSPYHMRLVSFSPLQGNGGNGDMQMAANAIQTGQITIIKDAQPDDAQDFPFTVTGNGLTPFSLDDDADGTLSNIQVFTTLANGNYSVTESAPVGGWNLTNLVCIDANGGTTTNLNTRTASINISAGESVTCTYTNTRNGNIVVDKVTNPGGDPQPFSFTTTGSGYSGFSLTDAAAPNNQTLAPGNYSVSETVPTGWDLTSSPCVSSIGDTETIGALELDAGETITCTFTNTKRGSITITKDAVPNDVQDFAYTSTSDQTTTIGSFTLDDDSGATGADNTFSNTQTFNNLQPGNYSVTETLPVTGWEFTLLTCSAGGTPAGATANIVLSAGASVSCTYTNTKNAQLKLVKTVTNDNGGTSVANDWDLSAAGSGGFTELTPDAANATFRTVTIGVNYALSETGPSGYTASAFSCNGGTQVGNNIQLSAGQVVTCTINNNDIAPQLKLVKTVTNDNGGTSVANDWDLTATGSGGFTELTPDAANATFRNVTADVNYALSEAGPSSYTASAFSCNGGTQVGNSIQLALAQVVTCTINNNDNPPELHLRKVVVNDNGGTATVADFTLTANGTGANDISGISPVDSGSGLQADTFALSETVSPGQAGKYTASAWVCVGGTQSGSDITVGIGQSATCTITNNDIPPQLHLRKVVINDNGGTATVANFTLTADGTGANDLSGTSPVDSDPTLQADTFALSETNFAGYTASAWSCVGGTQNGTNITVGVAQSATCTITNDDQPPILHLRKVVINDNGGTATVVNFPLLADGTGSNDLSGTSPVDSGAGLLADTWTLSETPVAGYTASAWSCVGGTQGDATHITLGLGQEATCTITNDDIPPQLHLRKIVVNDNGGTATVADFPLTADGTAANDLTGTSPVDSGPGLQADTWTLSETGPAGYSNAGFVCAGGTQVGQTIQVGIGGSATCTITNNDIPPQLHLRKIVVNDNGGTAVATDWTLTGDGAGSNDVSGSTPVDSGPTLQADTFALSESGPTGYATSGYVCAGGSQVGQSVTVGIGESATCTITNNDIQPKLIVIKHVINDNGGTAVAGDFTMNVTGNGPSPSSFAGVESPGTMVAINTGAYNVGETGPSGYAASFSADCTGSIAIGQTKTCTVTNDDIQPHLIVIKHVINDNGGTAVASDFTMSVTGSSPSPASFPGVEAPGTNVAINAGAYSVGESGPSGYAASFSADCSGSLAVGETKTCTVTNNDVSPQLTIIKHVINDNGGTAVAANFTMNVAGTNVSSPSFPGAEAPGTTVTLNAGAYNVTEVGVTGYTQTGASADCAGSIAVGESKTCTITNDDQPPSLTLNKVVVNDNGGTQPESAWTLNASGPTPLSGAGAPGNADVASGANFSAGSYALSESGPTGYAASAWSCTGTGTQNGANITLGLGQSAVCTITNDDISPTLTLVKTVVNNNGGTLTADDFPRFIDGNPVAWATAVNVNAGPHTASETPQTGYTASAWGGDCAGDGTVTLALAENKTCTITNDDIPPQLHLRKVVVNNNGGSATVADFPLFADGAGANDLAGTSPVDSGPGLLADTFTLSETPLAGYTASAWSCVGGNQNGSNITVGIGQSATCTITNDDQQAYITVTKIVQNDHGGLAAPNDFMLMLSDDGNTSPKAGVSVMSGVPVPVNPGTYTASETLVSGYAFDGFSRDCNSSGAVTVALGESKTCVLTNHDIAPQLTVIKHVINDNGGTAVAANFTMNVAGTNVSSPSFPGAEAPGTTVTLDAGAYNVTEVGVTGYTQTGTSADCAGSIAVGESKTCTITNDDQPPALHLRKVVINNNGGTATVANFTLTADGSGSNDLSGTSPVDSGPGLLADTFALSETSVAGYSASAWVCVGGLQNGSNITVGLGENVTCTITNNDIPPELHLRKVVINDNGGTATVANFTLTGNGTGANDISGTSPVDSGAGLQADTFALSETSLYGYTASAWVCVGGTQDGSNVTVGIGQSSTCTITNNDLPGIIKVIKNAQPQQGTFQFTTTGGQGNGTANLTYTNFSLTGSTAGGGNMNSQTLNAGNYTVTEAMQLSWTLTGIGGSPDPNTPYNCVVTGSGGSTGVGDINTGTATINLKNGDTVTCTFENTGTGATRTQGFWATHPNLAIIAWNGGSAFGHTFPGVANTAGIGDKLMCGRSVLFPDLVTGSSSQVMGGFWSEISRKSIGTKRPALDQSRMQLLQQLLAAELNASAFGSVPPGGIGSFGTWEAALCSSTGAGLKQAQQQAASFNSSGDSGTFTPGTSADPQLARFLADKPFWDIIIP